MIAMAMDDQAVQSFRAEVIARRNLPTIPTVLARILQLTEADAASAKDLVEVVEHDQALTSKILRLANSAFFGQSRRVQTIPRAVVLLGFSTVRNLALGVKIWDALGGGVTQARLAALWTHSVTVAVAGKALVVRLRAGDPDQAFTGGLLHDVGRLVLAMRFGEEYWRVAGAAAEGTISAAESAAFGVDHAEVGGWMLEAWNLPPGIVEVVRTHHAEAARKGPSGVVAIANRLAHWTDLATLTLAPEAEPLLAHVAESGVSAALWVEAVRGVRESGIVLAGGADA
jgi:putative nucleotidyltransferase with HDIG domain